MPTIEIFIHVETLSQNALLLVSHKLESKRKLCYFSQKNKYIIPVILIIIFFSCLSTYKQDFVKKLISIFVLKKKNVLCALFC